MWTMRVMCAAVAMLLICSLLQTQARMTTLTTSFIDLAKHPVLRLSGGKEGEGDENEDADEEAEEAEEDEAEEKVEEVVMKSSIRGPKGKATVSLSRRSGSLKILLKKIYVFLRTFVVGGGKSSGTVKKNKSKNIGKPANKNHNSSLEHLEKSFKTGDPSARVQKELRSFLANPPEHCKLQVGANIRSWVVTLVGAPGTIYEGESYKLKLVFPKDYPSKPPSVYFLKPCPRHMHVYSNGDICLNLLGRDWRPTMTAQALVISILSMLSSAKEKKLPQDNSLHADNPPGQQQEGWLYHDERC